MSKPKHLSCPNTPAGIRRINEIQELYDKDPKAYELREKEAKEERQREKFERVEYEKRNN